MTSRVRLVLAVLFFTLLQVHASAGAAPASNDPVELVDPFIGTGGTSGVGLIDDFPGASAPFGMLQWSPDTPSQPPSGGYLYRDTKITGFSLTHLSGAGCQVFGDFSVLPVLGDVSDAQSTAQSFSHEHEAASPGYYSVQLDDGVSVSLTAQARSGIARFLFPASSRAGILVDAASDQAGVRDSRIWIAGPAEIDGFAQSGGFCGMPNLFTVYFAIRFDRPFDAYGTWSGGGIERGAKSASGTRAGAWVSFDTRSDRAIEARAAVSYTGVDGAQRNLDAQARQSFDDARAATREQWRSLLSRVRIDGGTAGERRMLYTALYHALLSPTLFSDADGAYTGFDGRRHIAARGHAQYTSFSGWDVYRTQMPLLALLAPGETSDMMQSLVRDAQQGGWLPKWPVANGYTGVMGGDSAAPIFAQAYAFGARGFDLRAALAAMLKNAGDTNSSPGQGWYYPRPGLGEYLRRGYVVNAHTTSVSPVANGASETLEYALDDFSVAQIASAAGNEAAYRAFMRRSQNWAALFDTSMGLIMPRDGDGAFMRTPLSENGQSGFQEGNAYQYTWMVPQALGSLVGALGGSASAIARLDAFFSKLDAGVDQPYAWFGNEPTLASPWTYLYAGVPYRAERINRDVMLQLYAPTPDGLPGNDDLGTMSAWWAWNAMGLYPIDPGKPVLLLGAPLFTHVRIDSPSGRTIAIDAPQASDGDAYVQSLRVDGAPSNRAWTELPPRGVLHLDFALSATPNARFGGSPGDAPPNYAVGMVHFPPSTLAEIALPSPAIVTAPGQSASLEFAARVVGGSAVPLSWAASTPAGVSVVPAGGNVVAPAQGDSRVRAQVSTDASLQPGLYDVRIGATAPNGAIVRHVTAVVRVHRGSEPLPLLYGANFSDDTLTPIDPRTLAYGNPIAVGSRPGDVAVSHDGTRVYTANQGDDTVSVVSANEEKTITAVKVGRIPAGIRMTADGATLWVSNYGDGTLQAIDVHDLLTRPAIPIGKNPEEIAISPDGRRVYAALQGENALAVFDTRTQRVVAKVGVGRHPLGVVLSADGATAFVSSDGSDDVTAVDTQSLRSTGSVSVGKTPQSMAISPDGRWLYVADSGSNQVTPIDLPVFHARAPIAVGNAPFAVEFDAAGGRAFVANSGDNDCAVIDVSRGRVTGRIPTGSFPIALAR